MQAMIFAAGLGTRLRPLTDTMPKALVSVGGMPLLGRLLLKLRAAGARRVVVNVHHFAEQITDYLRQNSNFGLDILVSDERRQLLDTGGGLRKAAPLFLPDEPILIHNVDILSNADLRQLCDSCPTQAAATLVVSSRQTTRYLLFDDSRQLTGWVNILTGELRGPCADRPHDYPLSQLHRRAFAGIHIVSPSILPLMEGLGERFGIIDFYLRLCDKLPVIGVTPPGLRLLDVGKTDSLAEAELFLKTI